MYITCRSAICYLNKPWKEQQVLAWQDTLQVEDEIHCRLESHCPGLLQQSLQLVDSEGDEQVSQQHGHEQEEAQEQHISGVWEPCSASEGVSVLVLSVHHH